MTKEETEMIRTALRNHGEKLLKDARSRTWTGPQWREMRRQLRDAARPWFRLADMPDEYFGTSGLPVVNYLIEASARDKPWITWDSVPQNEMIAKHEWRKRLPGIDKRENIRFQLVRRTAVIADEVLDTEGK